LAAVKFCLNSLPHLILVGPPITFGEADAKKKPAAGNSRGGTRLT